MTLGYDDKNRLASAGSTSYQTNGRGERVRKAAGLGGPPARIYGYDESGQIVGEYNTNGVAQAEYVYLDTLPIAVIKSGVVAYVETDHLGTPRQVVNPTTNAVVWTWDLLGSAFGTNAPVAPSYTLNFRFPGQYYDGETGLNYNYFRDYDTGTGRYIENDPIGLLGGTNSYSYASNNPLLHLDKLGLRSCRKCANDHQNCSVFCFGIPPYPVVTCRRQWDDCDGNSHSQIWLLAISTDRRWFAFITWLTCDEYERLLRGTQPGA